MSSKRHGHSMSLFIKDRAEGGCPYCLNTRLRKENKRLVNDNIRMRVVIQDNLANRWSRFKIKAQILLEKM